MLTARTSEARITAWPALSNAAANESEAEMLALVGDQVAKFLRRNVESAALEKAGEIPATLRQAAAEAGLFGLTIDEAYGGIGLSLKGTCAIVEQIARVDRSVAIMIGLHAGLGTRGLVAFGSRAQKERWLPALASGERIASFAATEPAAGSDLGAVRTEAVRAGDSLRLTGEKAYVTNGGFAGLFTVLAKTPGLGSARGQSLLCVSRETPGVEVGPEEHKLGIRASSTVPVRFDGAMIPMDAVLGDPGSGVTQAHGVLAWGRTLMAAGCVGTAFAAIDASVEHVLTRRQFGRAISEFGAVRAQIAEMLARAFAMETLVRDAGHRGARGDDLDLASVIAKVACSEGAFALCDRAVQLHGALGFIEPAGVARMLRDCRVTRIFEGANDVLLVRLGAALVTGQARLSCESPARSELGAIAADLNERCASAIAAQRRIYGVRVVDHQLVLQRVAQAAIAAYTADRVAARVSENVRGRTDAIAALAVDECAANAHQQLDSIARASRDEERIESALGDRLGHARNRDRATPVIEGGER